ncbi:MAG: hypothetical protein IT212_11055 [Bacteroidia bacterium]|nr:hypothetical protein [Bacteroidia bacterium]
MPKININEFQDYNSKNMYDYLLVQNDTEFEIIIPREAVERIDDQYMLAIEFIGAAYAGQLLSEISSCFAYYTPCLNKAKPFLFQAIVTDIGKLADILIYISQGFNDPDAGEPFSDFHIKSAEFLNDAFEENVQCKTWGLLHIANNFLQE